jgi:hypothetical protein
MWAGGRPPIRQAGSPENNKKNINNNDLNNI